MSPQTTRPAGVARWAVIVGIPLYVCPPRNGGAEGRQVVEITSYPASWLAESIA
jgi:hypothetical protein